MQAVILAGGLGTRLRSVLRDLPKPMAPISGKPFLEYIIQSLGEYGIKEYLLLVGYESEKIINYFKNKKNIGVIIDYSQEPKPLNTGGALLNAWNKLQNEFIVLNGDTFFDIQYDILFEYIKKKSLQGLIALRYTKNISRYGFVDINEDNLISSFIEKGALPINRIDGYINGGIYYFKKRLLEKYIDGYNKQNISLEKNIFPELIKEKKLYGLPMGGKFIDIGIPSDYRKAQDKIPIRLESRRNPALFLDRDGVIIKDYGYVHGTVLDFIEDNFARVKTAHEEGKYVIVVTNQAGIARGIFTEKEAENTNRVIYEEYNKKDLKIDKFYMCPYHFNGTVEKFRKTSLARKPDPGMILQACEDFRIDITNSVIIGDNPETDEIKLYNLRFEKS